MQRHAETERIVQDFVDKTIQGFVDKCEDRASQGRCNYKVDVRIKDLADERQGAEELLKRKLKDSLAGISVWDRLKRSHRGRSFARPSAN